MGNQLNNTNQTICSTLTAAGRGAIAVVEVRGVDTTKLVGELFQPFNGRPLQDCLDRKLVYGTWTPTGEDVVVCNLGGQRLEVHCHGGTAAVESIVSALVEKGASEASAAVPYCSSENFWRAEVWRALPKATTERTASLVLRQLDRLPAAIDKIQATLTLGDAEAAVATIEQILAWSDFGISLTQVPSVVLCGQPNVGKSSLINSIVGFQRAIVHSSAGTTRDVVSQRTAVEGWPIELSDTAGLRDAEGPVEQIGIQNARLKIDAARLVIGVFDGASLWSQADQELFNRLDCDIVVHNKSDRRHKSDLSRPPGHVTSATQDNGIEPLISLIASKLVPEMPDEDAAWCVTPEAVARLQDARRSLLNNHRDRCPHAAMVLSGEIHDEFGN